MGEERLTARGRREGGRLGDSNGFSINRVTHSTSVWNAPRDLALGMSEKLWLQSKQEIRFKANTVTIKCRCNYSEGHALFSSQRHIALTRQAYLTVNCAKACLNYNSGGTIERWGRGGTFLHDHYNAIPSWNRTHVHTCTCFKPHISYALIQKALLHIWDS